MLLSHLFAFIAPHDCLMCGAEGAVVCPWCMPELCAPVPSRCYCCGNLDKDARTCRRCRRRSALGAVWVATEFDGYPKSLVHGLKYERVRDAAAPIAAALAERIPFLAADVVIVPVPTAANRVRMRGYDQAEEIASRLARSRSLRMHKLLWRVGNMRQVGASAQARREHMLTAFRVRSPKLVKGASVVLIDDVLTTGATLEAAARCLRDAGARRVDAAVFAQQMKR